MNVFKLHEFTAAVRSVLQWEGMCDALRTQGRGSSRFPDEAYGRMVADVARTQSVCFEAGFIQAGQKVGLIHQRLDLDRDRVDASYAAAELLNVYDALLEVAVTKRFLKVKVARATCIDNPNLMGPDVLKAFPKAKPDIVEAGNCLAAECNTAAVFHMMRVVEWGLRAFCAHLGFTTVRVSKKPGKTKAIPVDYAQWERILDDLQAEVDKRIEKLRPGTAKQQAQEFYYPALQDIRGIRDAWRNHTMHNRREFSSRDAEAIFGHVQRLMQNLANRFSRASRAKAKPAIASLAHQSSS